MARLLVAGLLATAGIAQPASAQSLPAGQKTECWRGWGYILDGESRAYKSQEMLLVTLGPTLWEAGRPVELFLLDRASGHISEVPPIRVIPENPRTYYRGRLNYVDTLAAIEDSGDLMTLGLSHIEPAAAGIPAKEGYNRWACGLPEE
ncbi:hypothetical protein HBA54_03320 [Pelagibius litoralis]|uniref:Uncharacterized protein n=1 Tax=Pelagibius litoralis TaxID=374515 RepID=A0A967C223_9PROT|nr:hypothetical protein [Pelagibius litoralis]NIA67613.1 hypothetical protein [Pelagibius litoralis]